MHNPTKIASNYEGVIRIQQSIVFIILTTWKSRNATLHSNKIPQMAKDIRSAQQAVEEIRKIYNDLENNEI